MSIQCQPVIGIDDRKPNMGFHMDYMTGMYFTDRSVNYNGLIISWDVEVT